VKRQELGNELQSSQHLRLQSASRKLLDIATVPAPSGKVQFKKCIDGIPRTEIERHCRASLDRTAEGSRPHVVFAERKKAALGRLGGFLFPEYELLTTKPLPLAALLLPQSRLPLRSECGGGW
jgi:hypothetical protein